LPKDRVRKLAPKYICPFKITQDYNSVSFKLDLPDKLRKRGIHPVFHASLLHIYHANDNQRFPGHKIHNMPGFAMDSKEWPVEKILSHSRKGSGSVFEVLFESGDTAWMGYPDVQHLQAIEAYSSALDVSSTFKLLFSS
ncbi:hypothetical protein K439DRAFT_1276075, partial [Ramaria rubella]